MQFNFFLSYSSAIRVLCCLFHIVIFIPLPYTNAVNALCCQCRKVFFLLLSYTIVIRAPKQYNHVINYFFSNILMPYINITMALWCLLMQFSMVLSYTTVTMALCYLCKNIIFSPFRNYQCSFGAVAAWYRTQSSVFYCILVHLLLLCNSSRRGSSLPRFKFCFLLRRCYDIAFSLFNTFPWWLVR